MPLAPVVTDPPNAFSLALPPSLRATMAGLHPSQAPAVPVQVAVPPVATPVISSNYQSDPQVVLSLVLTYKL